LIRIEIAVTITKAISKYGSSIANLSVMKISPPTGSDGSYILVV